VATSESTATSVYIRASCAYTVRNGQTATTSAPRHPAAHHATGTARAAKASDSARVASSPVPTRAIQPWSSR
jgi:hypothetical protein